MKSLKMLHNNSKNGNAAIQLERLYPSLYSVSGIDFTLYRQPTLKRAVQKRMGMLHLPFDRYLDHLKKNEAEAQALIQSMLIKVSSFFRDPATFTYLRRHILPQLVRDNKSPIRIWVPGCCNGEEVYSLAILIVDFLQEKGSRVPVQIFGTDLSDLSLERARAGIYSAKELRGVPAALRRRYFTSKNGSYQIDKAIRAFCTFARQNLVQDPPFSRLDLISCRNVLIYIEPGMQDKIMGIFHYALKDGGFLLLGKSENTASFHSSLYNVSDRKHCIYSKKPGTSKPVSFRLGEIAPTVPHPRIPTRPHGFEADPGKEMERILIERSNQASVLLSETGDVLQIHGDITSFLRIPAGKISLKMSKLAKEEIATDLRMLLKKARHANAPVRKRVENAGQSFQVEAVPLSRAIYKERFFVMIFWHDSVFGNGPHPKQEPRGALRLRRELAEAKAFVQNLTDEHEQAIQELKATNEEILSSNEELQSLNEELETAKEEVESSNEELRTVNEQLQIQMEALRVSEERFRLLVESVRDYAIFILDPQGRILTWNAGAERLKGYRAEEIIGSHFSRFYPKEDMAKPAMELRVATKEGVYQEEGWRIRKDGSRMWAHVTITAVRDKSGKLQGFAKVTRDLTERREADEKLKQSEERLRLMVAAVQDYAIYMLGPDGEVLSWNSGAQRLKGYRQEEIVGKNFSKFYTPEERKAGKPAHNLKIAKSKGSLSEEGWRIRKDGTRFWALITITALRDRDGKLRGFSKVTRDMTARRNADEALKKAYHELEEKVRDRTKELEAYAGELARSNADLQQFAYIASHDLQEPLRMVSSYVDLLGERLKDSADEDIREFIHFAKDGAVRAQKLIVELLEYSRIGSHGQEFMAVSFEKVVRHVLSLLDLLLNETDGKVTYGPLPTLSADRFQIEQLFQNLIANALKYRSPGRPPRIHITAKKKQGRWVFCVKDNGIGIEAQYLESIFIIFKRLHTRRVQGTGIGLALCKKIVERHAGKIWVESKPGAGSSFYFSLPG